MQDNHLDVVVVGGGQAGLGVGWHLKRNGQTFVIFERGRVGETWRSQRWDTFALNTPNWMNALPGTPYEGDDPDGFWLRDELIDYLDFYVKRHDLPIRTGTTVMSVAPTADGSGDYETRVDGPDGPRTVRSRAVVIASGIMQSPRTPDFAARMSPRVTQLSMVDYRNPEALPAGAVLVVGSGQSGCQITEDLVLAGRRVFLATSRVGRLCRRYRGRDVLAWWQDMGFWDVAVEELDPPALQYAAQPQISGIGPLGKTLSLQELRGRGVTLLGRAVDADGEILHLNDDLVENMTFADSRSAAFRQGIDDYIAEHGVIAEDPEDDPRDRPIDPTTIDPGPTRLDMAAEDISAIVWCTGVTADFSWIEAPILDDDGRPRHTRGVSPVEGIYFLGFPWLHTRKSGIIHGIDEDAAFVAEHIADRLSG